MTLLTPMMGLIAAMIVVPLLLALYMLKLRRMRRYISSTLLWKSHTEDVRANALMQRLRLTPLFLLQCLLLLLLVAGLMQPVLNSWTRPSGRIVLLIDQSASMQTLDAPNGATRLDEAKRLAIAQVESWQGGGLFAASPPEVMVIAFAQDVSVCIPFTTNPTRIREAIEAIEATDQTTQIGPAIALARAFATEQASEIAAEIKSATVPPLDMQLISDGNCPDLGQLALRKNETLSWVRCGNPDTPNQGISAAGAERRSDDPTLINAFVALRNESEIAVKREFQVRSNGTLIASSPEPITLPAAIGKGATRAPGAQKLSFTPLTLANSGVLSVTMLPNDAFATDDRAVIAIQDQQTLRVLMAGNDSAVEALINSLPSISLQQVSCQDFRKRVSIDANWTESFDVVVTIDCELPVLTAGRWLIFGKPPAIASLNPYGDQPRQAVRTWKSDHKVMAQSQFTDLVVDRAAAIAPTSDWTPLLEGSKGPLIVSGRTYNALVMYVAFLPMDSNWPFQRSFVNFTGQSIEFLGALGSAVTSESLEPGATLRMRVARGSTQVVVTNPRGDSVAQNPIDGEVVFGPLRNVGVYKVDYLDPAGKRKSRAVGVNLTDAAECNVAAAQQLNIPGGELQPKSIGFSTLAIWPMIVMLVLCLLILEWFIYLRSGGVT
ncbi:MAG: VWA domain-containing protein [Phycisphaerales bacterium]|nr:VWA domain-containing protein [Phycisphaerales bacterium]